MTGARTMTRASKNYPGVHTNCVLWTIIWAGKTGLNLLQSIRAKGCETPVIMLTGQGNRELDMAAMAAGAADYLDKGSLNEDLLERSIRYTLGRQRAEDALRESEQRLSAIANTATDAIVMLDQKGALTYWNPAAVKMFGYEKDEALGRNLHALLAPNSFYEKYKEGFAAFQKTGTGPCISKTFEFSAIRKDGSQFPMEVSCSAIPASDGWHAAGIVRDISNRKRMEQELIRTKKFQSLTILAGGIAHDYNNLLTAIMGNLDLAMMNIESGDNPHESLKEAQKAALETQKLTRRFLDISKGSLPAYRTGPIDTLLRRCIAECAERRRGNYHLKIRDDLRIVKFDERQMRTVFSNILENACESMPDAVDMEIDAQNVELNLEDTRFHLDPGRYIKITLQDHGTGIFQENLAKVFDPYFSTKPMGARKGMGMGLTTAYAVVQNHGGGMGIESKEGKGTRVTILLPADEERRCEC